MNAFRYHGMHERIIHVTTAAPETCDYIWNTIFAKWLMQGQNDTIFWISGKPGSGKSTLMKYIVSSPQTHHFLNSGSSQKITWTILHFFFDFRTAKTLANMQEGLYQSLLYQVMSALPLTRDMLQRYKLDVERVLVSHLMDKTVTPLSKSWRMRA